MAVVSHGNVENQIDNDNATKTYNLPMWLYHPLFMVKSHTQTVEFADG